MKMNRIYCLSVSWLGKASMSLALALVCWSSANADISLFTTQGDFTGWSGGGLTVAPQATPDLDGNGIDGLGNNSNAGGAGLGGSLGASDASNSTNFTYMFSPGLQGNAPLIAALGTSGIIEIDYTRPTDGNYFQLGLVLNYDGHFDQYFGSEINNGNGTYTTPIAYSFSPGSVATYLQLGVIFNSDANGAFAVDNIRIDTIPEPASLLLGACCLGLFAVRRQR